MRWVFVRCASEAARWASWVFSDSASSESEESSSMTAAGWVGSGSSFPRLLVFVFNVLLLPLEAATALSHPSSPLVLASIAAFHSPSFR